MGFTEYNGDLMGLPTGENYLVYRWDNPDCKILFSICRQGNGITGHLASDKRGLRKLKTAMKEMIDFVFTNFKWCEMIFAKAKTRSLKKLDEKVGFVLLGKANECDVYVLTREVYHG